MAETSSKSNFYAALFGGAFLIWGAFSALTFPGGEFPMPPMHMVDLGFDLVLTIAVTGLTFLNLRSPAASGLRSAAILVGVAGIVGGLIQLGIRFQSDHGWWTGHMNP